MKTMKKTALAVLLVILALSLSLVTCEDFLMGLNTKGADDELDFVDWEYEELPDGRSELTVYLDGTVVPVTETTGKPKQNRALGLQLAKMSHDYFEVVFASGAVVARATWEIGELAGISGVARSPGVDYSAVSTASAASASTIFVGRKQTMTLLGVGYLTHINKVAITSGQLLTSADKSVTFTVSPLIAKIGITTGAPAQAIPDSSFQTASRTATHAVTDISEANTEGIIINLGGMDYPLFNLPEYSTTAGAVNVIPATYIIDGLTTTAAAFPGASFNTLLPAVKYVAGPEVIKREPRYISGGQTWYAKAQIDFGATEVAIGTYVSPGVTPVAGGDFYNRIPIVFTLSQASNGIFSIVFSVPVYAMTTAESTNAPGTFNEVWHITPGYGQNLYNLDSGFDSGGCVLMGINVQSLDWLEIFTTGIGFNY